MSYYVGTVLCQQLETGKAYRIELLQNYSVNAQTKTKPKQLMLVFEGNQINDQQKISFNGKKINFIILKDSKPLDRKNDVKLVVKTLKGQTLPVSANFGNNIKQLKQIIFSLYNFQVERQKLVFHGKVLADTQLISEQQFDKGGFFVLMLTAPLNKRPSSSSYQNKKQENVYQLLPVVKVEHVPLSQPQRKVPLSQSQRKKQNSIRDIMEMGFQRKEIQQIMATQSDAQKVIQILISGGMKQQPAQKMNKKIVQAKKQMQSIFSNYAAASKNEKKEVKKYEKTNPLMGNKKIQQVDRASQPLYTMNFLKNEKKEKKEKKEDEYNENECKICMNKMSEMICIPCYHLCVCQKCSQGLKGVCPICRNVGQFKKIFKL